MQYSEDSEAGEGQRKKFRVSREEEETEAGSGVVKMKKKKKKKKSWNDQEPSTSHSLEVSCSEVGLDFGSDVLRQIKDVFFFSVLSDAEGEARPCVRAGAAGVGPGQGTLALAARLTRCPPQTQLQLKSGPTQGQVRRESNEGARRPFVHQRWETQNGHQSFGFREHAEGERSEEDDFVLSHEIRAQQLLQQ